jgi:hypothetical protein
MPEQAYVRNVEHAPLRDGLTRTERRTTHAAMTLGAT